MSMHSLNLDRCRPFRHATPSTWHDPDEEVTSELSTLGALAAAVTPVEPSTPIAEVRALLAESRIAAVVVVDADQALRGVVTRTDVLRAPTDTTAGEAMSSYVFVMSAESAIERAAALMATENVGQVVVTSGGAVVGMVSALDIARHFAIRTGYLVDPT
jgi:CBS domain-containing protein